MKLGDNVTYIRHNEKGILQGSALLKGIGLNGEGRQIVLLKDEAGESFNAFLTCVNPTDDFCEKFRELIGKTDALGKEGNFKARELVEEYNSKIKALDDELLGEVMDL